ncbi:hypothetical protein F1880_009797 [Penicillium rolfsii]|nr:hypothetical protein F1880_009797 [Penicillium rolfsii]
MSALELFTDPRLPCPQRVHLVIKELGIDVNIHDVNLEEKGHKSNEFLEMNPFGALPCLKDNSFVPPFVLYESRAIVRYLAIKYGHGRLLPNPFNVQATALFEQGASTELTSFDPAANRLVFEGLFKPKFFAESEGSFDSAVVASLTSRLMGVLDILDRILGHQGYMAGQVCFNPVMVACKTIGLHDLQEFSVVDLFYVPYMHHLTTSVCPSVLENRPHLKAWWENMMLRPGYIEITQGSRYRLP